MPDEEWHKVADIWLTQEEVWQSDEGEEKWVPARIVDEEAESALRPRRWWSRRR